MLVALSAAPLPLPSQILAREYATRRDALAARIPDAVIVVFGAAEPEKDYLEFFQNPPMLYLTGIKEPDAALVMVKENGRVSATVFVLPRDPAAEVWTGTRIGTEGATARTGLPARSREALAQALDSLARLKLPFYVAGDLSPNPEVGVSTEHDLELRRVRANHPQLQVRSATAFIMQLRGKKSPAELALIRRAVDITVESHVEAMRNARPGMYEYELEADIERGFRRRGAERTSFATIVGSGPNSTVLHYNVNDRQMQAGEVVVMDIGASFDGYAADVTRTIPLNGAFTQEQREVYQIVRDAQAAAERNARPGMKAVVMSDSAWAVIAAGLTRLGLIESPTATYDVVAPGGAIAKALQVRLYYMHGLGHGIGLEVHDPDQFYFTQTIGEGSAFTIEPGIYVRRNLLEILADTPRNRTLIANIRPAVERYQNTGVRIEDDYIVSDKGLEWISRAPREIAEIEALMKSRIVP